MQTMKLVTFRVHTEERVGALTGDRVVDLNSAYALKLLEKRRRRGGTRTQPSPRAWWGSWREARTP